MHDYITKRIAELEEHVGELRHELATALTVIAELREAQKHENAPLLDPKAEQGGAGEPGATALGTGPASASGQPG